MNTSIGDVLIDGSPVAPGEASISVFDIGFQRGYGCFEAMRAYNGRIFRIDGHLDRLQASATKLHLPLPPRDDLASWCRTVGERAGDSVVRIFVSGGVDPKRLGTESRVAVYAEAVEPPGPSFRVQSRVAPWHSDGVAAELTGAKILSYGYNLAAGVAARRAGFDDALLFGRSGHVLEGPTFSIAWTEKGGLVTPTLDLGILASITRAAVLEVAADLGIAVNQGVFELDRVFHADEVMVLSTVKEVLPVTAVDETTFPIGSVTSRLAAGYRDLVAAELDR
jgi:branched-chain amino acid aminotransferase